MLLSSFADFRLLLLLLLLLLLSLLLLPRFVDADADVVSSLFFDDDAFGAACVAFSVTDAGAGAFAAADFAAASASASAAAAFPIRRGASNCDISDSLFFHG